VSDDEHFYPNPWNLNDPDGQFPSVTTILGAVAAKPALGPWAAREAARFAVENWTQIGEMLVDGGDMTEAIRWIAAEPKRIAKDAADRGSILHRVAEAMVKGQPISLTDEEDMAVAPFLDSLHRFVTEMQPTYEWAEATVFHQWQRYAGTTDGGVRFAEPIPIISEDGELVDVLEAGMLLNLDYKTGNRVWVEAVAQHVGYATATHMDLKDGLGTIVPMPKCDGAVVVHIRPEGYKVHGVRITPRARAAWEQAVGWFHWLRNHAPTDLGIGVRAGALLVEDLPGFNVRQRNSLALAGVQTLAELEALGEAGFRKLAQCGPSAALTARKLLALEGRTWTTPAVRGAA
jgi:hypothetical protein